MMEISHKIELKPNNKQKTYIRKACGCARLAWNWGLGEWKREYAEGGRPSGRKLRNRFNAIRGEQFPFTYEVTKYATAHPFDCLQVAFERFFKHISDYPVFKRKKDGEGSFYIGNDVIELSYQNRNSKSFKDVPHNTEHKHQYLRIPNLGWVRMTECLRFVGKINSVAVSMSGDRFYASFSCTISEEEYLRTHPGAGNAANADGGLDLGVKSVLVLSDGIAVENPKHLARRQRRLKRLQRQLSKRVHAKTKQERLEGKKKSKNYIKKSLEVRRENRKVSDSRRDFQHKVTTILSAFYGNIGMEDLNVKGMVKNHRLAKAISDVGFGELRRQLEYKAECNGHTIVHADRFCPSSKTCSRCGNVVDELPLKQRTYICGKCGFVIDRDLNAALNLRSLVAKQSVGRGSPEFTPVDLTALLSAFARNGIATSKVEAGRQHDYSIL